mmetsp:Transcript_26267/g.78769  ORF Transcript_26267/g.78769 Transcript_26267/m.78769 type:complete len:163 (+) Transcript_26267:129-617(+)
MIALLGALRALAYSIDLFLWPPSKARWCGSRYVDNRHRYNPFRGVRLQDGRWANCDWFGRVNSTRASFPVTERGLLGAARRSDQNYIEYYGFWADPANMWLRFYRLCRIREWWALREIVDINAYVLFRFVVVYCWSLIFVLAAASFVDCADGGGWLVRLDLA